MSLPKYQLKKQSGITIDRIVKHQQFHMIHESMNESTSRRYENASMITERSPRLSNFDSFCLFQSSDSSQYFIQSQITEDNLFDKIFSPPIQKNTAMFDVNNTISKKFNRRQSCYCNDCGSVPQQLQQAEIMLPFTIIEEHLRKQIQSIVNERRKQMIKKEKQNFLAQNAQNLAPKRKQILSVRNIEFVNQIIDDQYSAQKPEIQEAQKSSDFALNNLTTSKQKFIQLKDGEIKLLKLIPPPIKKIGMQSMKPNTIVLEKQQASHVDRERVEYLLKKFQFFARMIGQTMVKKNQLRIYQQSYKIMFKNEVDIMNDRDSTITQMQNLESSGSSSIKKYRQSRFPEYDTSPFSLSSKIQQKGPVVLQKYKKFQIRTNKSIHILASRRESSNNCAQKEDEDQLRNQNSSIVSSGVDNFNNSSLGVETNAKVSDFDSNKYINIQQDVVVSSQKNYQKAIASSSGGTPDSLLIKQQKDKIIGGCRVIFHSRNSSSGSTNKGSNIKAHNKKMTKSIFGKFQITDFDSLKN